MNYGDVVNTSEGVTNAYKFWNYAIGSDSEHIDEVMIIESGVVFEPWRVQILHQHGDENPDAFSQKKRLFI